MASREIIGWLSEEDRSRWHRSYARTLAAMNGVGGASLDEAVSLSEESETLFAELRRKHEIPDEETVDFSLFDGAIVEVDE